MHKIKKYFLLILAGIGLIFSLYMVFFGVTRPPTPKIAFPPPTSPYDTYVAGAGIVEASSRNIVLGVPFVNIVAKIFVKVGDRVKKDTPLFQMDIRKLEADLIVAIAKKDIALSKYTRLINLPRIEEVYPKEDVANRAKNEYEDQKLQYELYESVKDKKALSLNELNQRFFAYQIAKYQYKEAKDDLSLLKAGAWKYDLAISKMEIEEAIEEINSAKTQIDRSIIKAPVDGTVMQINTKVGEAIDNLLPEQAPMLFGSLDPLHLRVDVDENESWRVEKDTKAIAFLRGNRSISVELKFLYIEPYIIPKKSFTGENTERVDTRVLQVIFEFDKKNLPIYPGQLMDVFIKTSKKYEDIND